MSHETPSNATAVFALVDGELVVVKSRSTPCDRADLSPGQRARVAMSETLLSEAFNPHEHPASFSVREAMRDAGVPNWQKGSGVSSADAIRFVAAQRDSALRATRLLSIALICYSVVIAGCLWAMN